jgi:hypothetical protein
VTMCDVSALDFIRAHIGDPGEDLDETKLNQKYSMDNGSWGDMPHAGMFKNARESIRTSLKTMQQGGDPIQRTIATYQNYMRAQSTIHTQAILVDLMMSDRVLHCAQCLDRLSARMNEGVRQAFMKEVSGEAAEQQREAFKAYPDATYYLKLLHTFSLHNKYIRANAVNLTTLWAIMVSDTLTHLGAHHETWNWMMYTVQVMGGAGHLRAQTDDHGSKTQVTFTSKPNSVGFNAVITKTFKVSGFQFSFFLHPLYLIFIAGPVDIGHRIATRPELGFPRAHALHEAGPHHASGSRERQRCHVRQRSS